MPPHGGSYLEPGEYDSLVARASASTSGAADLLLTMRQHKIHQPEIILLHGGRLLTSSSYSLGNEVWTVMEQVLVAAVELGFDDWRDYCLEQLTKKFPGSVRVERLKGICQESEGKWAEARKTYQSILADKPEDTTTQKRLIALLKQRGKMVEAIEEINKYLDQFSTDAEAWQELAELYIETGALQRAIFCFEELLVQNKRSTYYLVTHAELLYSVADYDSSRKYFSLACYLDETNLRALWGLVAVNMAMSQKDKGNEKMTQLQTFAIEKLKKVYTGGNLKGSGHGKAAIALLANGMPEAA